MKQKLHSLLLMVVLLSWSMISVASDFDDGILKYTIISPSNLEVQCDGFTDAHKNDESVAIPETVNYRNRTYSVVSIVGDHYYGFGGTNIKAIKLPSSLRKIGSDAFIGCKKLTEISIPDGVEEIGKSAFNSCDFSLVVIPSSVKEIDDDAFANNKMLMEVFFLGA